MTELASLVVSVSGDGVKDTHNAKAGLSMWLK